MNEMQYPGPTAAMSQAAPSVDFIRERAKDRGEPDWLVDVRARAFDAYERFHAPKFRRTELKLDVAAAAFRAAAEKAPLRQVAGSRQEGVLHASLLDAAREHEHLVRPILSRAFGPEATKWDALQAALWTSGSFFHVEKGVEVTAPIASASRVGPSGAVASDIILLERQARATILDRWTAGAPAGKDALALHALLMDVGEGAELKLTTLQDLTRSTTLLTDRRATLRRDARLAWVDGAFGSKTTLSTNETRLAEPGSKLDFVGAFFGSADQHFDITTSALHHAPHTDSQLNMKGALTEKGYAANYSVVFIGETAANSSGHQHQETLILGEGARADAIPKLDVENNDVSASHGASVGQVDPDQLFYLRSRGLRELDAKRLIVQGFFEPLMRKIPMDDVRDEMDRAIVARL